MNNNLKDIERSIIKKYRKEIFRPFVKAVNEYNLICENDTIAVCISGGKDSFLLAKCLEELKRHGKVNFNIKYLLMDPGYEKEHLDIIKKNSEILNIELNIFKSDIFKHINNNKDACYLCARKRRGALYSEAQKLGCNKIALGHHFNDVVETILMSMLYNGEFKTMLPILNSVNYKPLQLIRPLYYVKEEAIINWCNYNNLKFIDCACRITKKDIGKRKEMKNLIKYLNDKHKDSDINIFNSTKDINLETILSYKQKSE